jgi:hypothetical protein
MVQDLHVKGPAKYKLQGSQCSVTEDSYCVGCYAMCHGK